MTNREEEISRNWMRYVEKAFLTICLLEKKIKFQGGKLFEIIWL